MADRSIDNFKATKNARYTANTTGDISSGDSADTFEDVADSFVNWTDGVLHEDDMASDSDTHVPTQQSVKAYVDAATGGGLTLAAGVYTPTLTGVANVDAVVVQGADWPYMRVGNVVTVSGQINIDPTAATTTTTVRVSLPVASNFANSNTGLAGTMVETGGTGDVGAIRPDPTNDEAQIVYVPAGTGAKSFSVIFTYTII